MFDLSKILDLSKKFALPNTFLKSKLMIWKKNYMTVGKLIFLYIFQREKATTKHLSSSTEDLILLFKAEKNIVKFLKSEPTKDSTKEIIESYLKSVDFDEKTETEDYVYHPVNAYHLLKRTTKWIPKLTKVIPNLDFEFHLPQGIIVVCRDEWIPLFSDIRIVGYHGYLNIMDTWIVGYHG